MEMESMPRRKLASWLNTQNIQGPLEKLAFIAWPKDMADPVFGHRDASELQIYENKKALLHCQKTLKINYLHT